MWKERTARQQAVQIWRWWCYSCNRRSGAEIKLQAPQYALSHVNESVLHILDPVDSNLDVHDHVSSCVKQRMTAGTLLAISFLENLKFAMLLRR